MEGIIEETTIDENETDEETSDQGNNFSYIFLCKMIQSMDFFFVKKKNFIF